MKLYLAAPWVLKHAMPIMAKPFTDAGHTITERWWEQEDKYPDYPSNQDNPELEDIAVSDFIGVINADALVVFNSAKSEGKAAEVGIGIACLKPVILIGARTNIFHYMPNVHPVKDTTEALAILE